MSALLEEIARLRKLLKNADTRAYKQRCRAEMWKARALGRTRFQQW